MTAEKPIVAIVPNIIMNGCYRRIRYGRVTLCLERRWGIFVGGGLPCVEARDIGYHS